MTTTTTISANSQYLHQRRQQQQQPPRMNDDNNDNEQQQQRLEIYHASIALSSDFHPLNLKTVIPGYENLYQLTCRLFTFISVKLIEWNGVTKKFVYFLKNLNFHLAKIIGSILDVTSITTISNNNTTTTTTTQSKGIALDSDVVHQNPSPSHNDLHSQSHLKVLNPVPQKLYEIFKSTLNDCERFYLSISHRKIEGISRESQESLIKNRRRDFREIFMNIYSISAACGLVSLEEKQLMKEKICNLEWLDTQSPFNLDDPLPPPKHQATSTANPATIVPSSTETSSSSSASLSETDHHRHHSSATEKSVVLDEKREIFTKMDAHPKLLVPPPPPLSPPPLPSSPPPPSILSSSSLSDPDPVSFSVKQLLDRDRDESTHDWDGEKIFFGGDRHQNSIIIDAGSNFHDRSSVDIAVVDITSNENHTNSFGKESSSSSLMMIANEESHLSDNNRSDIYNETDHKEIVVGGYTPFRSLHSQEQKQQRLNPHKWNRKVSQQYRKKLTPFVRSTCFTEEFVHFLHPHSRGGDEKREQRYYQQHHSWEIAHSDQSRSSRDLHFPPIRRHNFNNNEKNYYHNPY